MNQEKKEFVEHDIDQLQILIRSSTLFIEQSLEYIAELSKAGKLSHAAAKGYFSEILHSILFIGYINVPTIEPCELLPKNVLKTLEKDYPDVLTKYRSHLPLRTPYSILLDMVVKTAENGHEGVLEKLLDLNGKMYVSQNSGNKCGNDFCLASTVVSYCYFENNKGSQKPKKYFGASVACTGKAKRDFFINLSCVKTWNRKVALGVCLAAKGSESILLPKTVFSAAFTMLNDPRDEGCGGYSERIGGRSGQRYVPKAPCEKCWEIFPEVVFSPPERDEKKANWKHGNCAECEAMSSLLNGERSVDEGVRLGKPPQPLTADATDAKLMPLLKPRIDSLKNALKNRIKTDKFEYFKPGSQ